MRSFTSLLSRVFLGALLLSLVGQGCTNGPDPAAVAASKPVTINVWGVVDDVDAYDGIFKDYHTAHPYVTINYRRFRLEEYENQLVNAMAEDSGPDIFLIHNDWVGKYMTKISPMPLSTKVVVQTIQGTLKKQIVPVLQTNQTVSLRALKNDFADVVAQDFVRSVNVSPTTDKKDFQSRIVALPMSVDTLALYVNKDLLNAAGIATVPTTWDAFQAAVKKLVKLDQNGDILQAGAAIGTANNIDRATDLLSVLMMQNGAQMAAPDGTPTFQTVPQSLQDVRDVPPSFSALSFYTDFANPAKDVYTWNTKQPNSLDAFIQGKTAFYFGYSYDLPTIKARAPKLNLTIAPLPQIDGNPVVNIANYWGWTVSKKTKSTDVSWDLVNFMTSKDEAKKYLDIAVRPAALRALLPNQMESEDVGVFASQVLTAQTWYRGNDPQAMENAFTTLIEQASSTDPADYSKIMTPAVEKIAQTYQ